MSERSYKSAFNKIYRPARLADRLKTLSDEQLEDLDRRCLQKAMKAEKPEDMYISDEEAYKKGQLASAVTAVARPLSDEEATRRAQNMAPDTFDDGDLLTVQQFGLDLNRH